MRSLVLLPANFLPLMRVDERRVEGRQRPRSSPHLLDQPPARPRLRGGGTLRDRGRRARRRAAHDVEHRGYRELPRAARPRHATRSRLRPLPGRVHTVVPTRRRRFMSSTALAAVVGAAETDRIGYIDDQSALELHAEAARNALDDAGISRADVDGIASAAVSPVAVAHYLGIEPQYIDHTWIGGCSFVVHLRHAVAAVRSGLCQTVLITHGESGRS